MTSPEQLRSVDRPTPVVMRPQPGDSPVLRATYNRVATPYHWANLAWSDQEWRQRQTGAHRRHWLALAGDEPAGGLPLEGQPQGEGGVVTFRLGPELGG